MSFANGVLALLSGVILALAVLTALGARRRGRGPALAVVAGLFFPITWAVWYVADERPYDRARAR